jgi:hypothetical protein
MNFLHLDKTLETTHVGLTSLIEYMQRRKELINYSKKNVVIIIWVFFILPYLLGIYLG